VISDAVLLMLRVVNSPKALVTIFFYTRGKQNSDGIE
jgi:hypothetical protein